MRPWLDWRTHRDAELSLPLRAASWRRGRATSLNASKRHRLRASCSPSAGLHETGTTSSWTIPMPSRTATRSRSSTVRRQSGGQRPPTRATTSATIATWGEMLSVHELSHLAHLTRPSRNPFQRHLWAIAARQPGPIALKAPRWVYEGYATLVEGRVTGTGRPNNAWRPAMLRQWAIEGRLPTYGQLSAWDDHAAAISRTWAARRFSSGSCSARAEAIALVHVWRRMTARIVRGFDGAFTGVFGATAPSLYGRHSAELTCDAMAAKAALERAGLVEGELVQRLDWGTGDPAVSPNGTARRAHAARTRPPVARRGLEHRAASRWTPLPRVAARLNRSAIRKTSPTGPSTTAQARAAYAARTNGRPYAMPRWFRTTAACFSRAGRHARTARCDQTSTCGTPSSATSGV